MAVKLPAGFTCHAQRVLNDYEQALYNVLDEYFNQIQKRSNRCNILSQVRVPDAVELSHIMVDGVQVNAMSFDLVVTDANARILCVFEVDGDEHLTVPRRMHCDAIKDAIAAIARIPLFRVRVVDEFEHPDVVHARLSIQNFSREGEYPFQEGVRQFSEADYPNSVRRIEPVDIEQLLIHHNWPFPPGWEYVTEYELRDVNSPASI